ncbi:uncharacterized protein LOC124628232 [Ictalurus punctatus]|uniref:Uncharacterized protein LOC124628232 n=1 Tax=Ictalurus punctatus TaxID=7998 RepID=A0A9F7R9S2_ICTPU|nr:uncharacterized protein LOC124628232 [Ictalurus punctatus]
MGWWLFMILVILQWNARSLIANGQEFKKFVTDLLDKPQVICVQETWLKPQLDFVIYGYTTIRNDRETGKGGGVATFVRNDVKYNLVNKGKEHESVVVRIQTGKDSIMIVNFYNPCNRLSTDTLNAVCGVTQGKTVWCGDFNAHSTIWRSKNTDINGSVIEEFIDDKNLVCVNDGKGTQYSSSHNTESAIDLTIMSTEMAGISLWEVLDQSTVGSDHYPIITRIEVEIHQDSELKTPRWRLDKADWQMFQMLSEIKCVELVNKDIRDVEEMNRKVTRAIIQTAEETIPKKTRIEQRKSVPWWNESCTIVIKKRNKALRQLKAHHTLVTLINYKRAQAVVRRTIRSAKRGYLRQFCNKNLK